MSAYYLYCITLPDRRAYIGRSANPTRRFSQHCMASSYIGEAIRHYGPEKCKLRILCVGKESYISELEEFAIDAFKTFYPFGYNRTGGRTGYGIEPAEQLWSPESTAPRFGLSESSDARRVIESALSSAPLDVIIDTGVSSEQPPDSGWIEITVNIQGRHAIERIFPGWAFNWRPVQWPHKASWSALLHLPSLAKRKVHFNRFEFGMASRLSEADDAELACMVAQAASDQGVRVSWLLYLSNGQPVLHFPEHHLHCRAPASLIRSGRNWLQELASY